MNSAGEGSQRSRRQEDTQLSSETSKKATPTRIAVIIGTRPEAIKLASVVRALREAMQFVPVVLSTGQHRDLLQQTLTSLGLEVDADLDVMADGQTLDAVCARIHTRLPAALRELEPDAVLVQGDTTTAMTSALCAFHAGLPVGHVEAGLRTHDLTSPFPEEANRQLIARLARWSFAPTESSAENLRSEGVPANRIVVTGNTAIDTLLQTCDPAAAVAAPRDLLLITLHRRESFGSPLRDVLHGVTDFLVDHPAVRALWPVHPNPKVQEAIDAVADRGEAFERIQRIDPLAYRDFCEQLLRCRCVLTDSGGLQEEAPSLGKRVLIARQETERPEAVDAGLNRLVGRRREDVAAALRRAWSEAPYDGPLPAPNPYGDGRAAQRIVERLAADFSGARSR